MCPNMYAVRRLVFIGTRLCSNFVLVSAEVVYMEAYFCCWLRNACGPQSAPGRLCHFSFRSSQSTSTFHKLDGGRSLLTKNEYLMRLRRRVGGGVKRGVERRREEEEEVLLTAYTWSPGERFDFYCFGDRGMVVWIHEERERERDSALKSGEDITPTPTLIPSKIWTA